MHLYCPELYGHNGGASLVVCNTEKGKQVFCQAQAFLYGHALDFATALKYQGPLHRHIPPKDGRSSCRMSGRFPMKKSVRRGVAARHGSCSGRNMCGEIDRRSFCGILFIVEMEEIDYA